LIEKILAVDRPQKSFGKKPGKTGKAVQGAEKRGRI